MNIFPCIKAIIRRDDEFLIVKRASTEEHSPNKWSFVGGGVELGESYIDALHREVAEEAQIKVKPIKYVDSKAFCAAEGGVVLVSYILCEYVSGKVKLNEEHDDYMWIKTIPDFLIDKQKKLLKMVM